MSILGIECGGTSSTAILVARNGDDTSEIFRFGPGNFMLLSSLELESLFESLKNLISAKKVSLDIEKIGVGMPGVLTDSHKQTVRDVLIKTWPTVSEFWIGNDLETALACLNDTGDYSVRVIIISGTGSCCYGTNGHDYAKVGGFGHVIGDRCSGYSIGYSALRQGVKEYERNDGKSAILTKIMEMLRLQTLSQLAAWSVNATKTEIASLAPIVLEAWAEGEAVSTAVVKDAIQDLASDLTYLIQKLALVTSRTKVQIGLTGSLLTENAEFSEAVTAQLIRSTVPAQLNFQRLTDTYRGALNKVIEGGGPSNQNSGHIDDSKDSSITRTEADWAKLVLPVSTALSPTECRNPNSMNLDTMSIGEAISLWLAEEGSFYKEIEKQKPVLERLIKKVTQTFQNGGRLFYVGAGTSGRLGVLDASECPPTFKTPAHWVQGIMAGGTRAIYSSVEGAEDSIIGGMDAVTNYGVNSGDVLIGIASSGRTPYVWGSLYRAKELGAFTCILAFNPNMTLRHEPDESIIFSVGPEVLTGSTRLKSGSATKCILNMITTLSMVQYGKCLENLMVDLNPSNQKLRERAVRIVSTIVNGNIGEERHVKPEIIQEVTERNLFDIKKSVSDLRSQFL